MVGDIDGVTEILRSFRQAFFNFQTKQRRKTPEHMAKGGDMLRITRAEQAINRAENTDQNTVDNGKNKTNNI